MNYYLELLKKLTRKYLWELILLMVALLLGLGSFTLFLNSPPPSTEKIGLQKTTEEQTEKKLVAEIAGAVNKPGVYQLFSNARLVDLLKLAGGLSDQADKAYFSINFNLAHYIQDQEKVYVPSQKEIVSGLFSQNLSPNSQTADESEKVDLNSASLEELDSLPGVGQVTAQKIIDNRPYQSTEDILTKKVVKQNVFDSIKNQLITK